MLQSADIDGEGQAQRSNFGSANAERHLQLGGRKILLVRADPHVGGQLPTMHLLPRSSILPALFFFPTREWKLNEQGIDLRIIIELMFVHRNTIGRVERRKVARNTLGGRRWRPDCVDLPGDPAQGSYRLLPPIPMHHGGTLHFHPGPQLRNSQGSGLTEKRQVLGIPLSSSAVR